MGGDLNIRRYRKVNAEAEAGIRIYHGESALRWQCGEAVKIRLGIFELSARLYISKYCTGTSECPRNRSRSQKDFVTLYHISSIGSYLCLLVN